MDAIRACPLCGENRPVPLYRRARPGVPQGHWTVARCSGCLMVYLQEQLDYQVQGEEFEWRRSSRDEASRRDREQPILRRMSRGMSLAKWLLGRRAGAKVIRMALRHKREGRWCDFGCGRGLLLRQVPDEFQRVGVDISPAQAEIARMNVPGAEIIAAPVTEAPLAEGSFDVVSMQSYIEHEQKPIAALALARRCLKPGGVLVLKTPNYACWNRRLRGWKWCGFRFPDHCNYFTYAHLADAVRRADLDPLPSPLFDRLPCSDNMYLAARKRDYSWNSDP